MDPASGGTDGHPAGGTSGAALRAENWWLYQGTGQPLDLRERDRRWPPPPHWRTFGGGPDLPPPPADDDTDRRLGALSVVHPVDWRVVSMVNAAIYLRRPLLVTGRPGSGKSSLAYRIARELGLGRVLRWPVVSRTVLRTGQYDYDAIGRAQATRQRWPGDGHDGHDGHDGADTPSAGASGDATAGETRPAGGDIGDFIHLGPLGTALLPRRLPRVLLIDEMDKSDLDLPNDLLNVFEDGEFAIPELQRAAERHPEVVVHTADPGVRAPIRNGVIRCHEFPIVVITSNSEREFPPAFRRRCLTLELADPDAQQLAAMVAAHFPRGTHGRGDELIRAFLERNGRVGGLAADQLLNAVQLSTSGAFVQGEQDWADLLDAIWHRLAAAT